MAEALTGPVERGDVETVQKHLDALKFDEREIYTILSKKLIKISALKYPERNYKKLYQILTK